MAERRRDQVEPQSEWRRQARCRDADPDIFFSDTDTAPAISICSSCPVRDDCREWALKTRQEFGVWGGEDFGVANREAASAARRRRAKKHRRQLQGVLPQEPTCPNCDDSLGVFKIESRTYRCIGCGNLWKVA